MRRVCVQRSRPQPPRLRRRRPARPIRRRRRGRLPSWRLRGRRLRWRPPRRRRRRLDYLAVCDAVIPCGQQNGHRRRPMGPRGGGGAGGNRHAAALFCCSAPLKRSGGAPLPALPHRRHGQDRRRCCGVWRKRRRLRGRRSRRGRRPAANNNGNGFFGRAIRAPRKRGGGGGGGARPAKRSDAPSMSEERKFSAEQLPNRKPFRAHRATRSSCATGAAPAARRARSSAARRGGVSPRAELEWRESRIVSTVAGFRGSSSQADAPGVAASHPLPHFDSPAARAAIGRRSEQGPAKQHVVSVGGDATGGAGRTSRRRAHGALALSMLIQVLNNKQTYAHVPS